MLANSDQKILAQDVKSDMDKVLSKMKKARGKSERFHLGMDFLIDGQISSFCPGHHGGKLLTLTMLHKITQSL